MIYDVILVTFGRFGKILPTVMHKISLDKHICGRVDCHCTWLTRNATPQFRFKMTKIGDLSRTVARATEVRIRNPGRFLESPDDALQEKLQRELSNLPPLICKNGFKISFFGEK